MCYKYLATYIFFVCQDINEKIPSHCHRIVYTRGVLIHDSHNCVLKSYIYYKNIIALTIYIGVFRYMGSTKLNILLHQLIMIDSQLPSTSISIPCSWVLTYLRSEMLQFIIVHPSINWSKVRSCLYSICNIILSKQFHEKHTLLLNPCGPSYIFAGGTFVDYYQRIFVSPNHSFFASNHKHICVAKAQR